MSIKLYDKSGSTPQEILLAGISPVDQILNGTSKNAIANKAVYNALKEKIEKTVSDLVNYYSKADVYNKAEVRALINAVDTLTMEVVSSLPVSDISTTTIYLLKPTGSNVYDEYVYINNAWVKIGTTELDLSNYVTNDALTLRLADFYTKAEIITLLTDYAQKVDVYDKNEIDALLDDKQDSLTFDDEPTEDSTNVVKSGGVYSAVDDVYKVMGQNGAKNLLRYPYADTTKTINGITFTDNKDGSVTVNGTASALAQFIIVPRTSSGNFTLSTGTYILNGCPAGGSNSTYRMNWSNSVDSTTGSDYGEGSTITVTNSQAYYGFFITIASGTTINNLTFYPMIRLAEDTDSTYQPYTETNVQLMNSRMSYVDNGILGAKNLNSFPYYETSKTSNGITFTLNEDGTVKANGTATAQAFFNMHVRTEGASDALIMKNGKYFLSGCPSGGSSTTYSVQVGVTKNSAYYMLGRDYGEGAEINVDGDDTHTGEAQVQVQILISNGATVSNLTFKPMIRLVTDGDSTYQPYAMSNQQVTEYLKTIIRPNLLDNPWFTVNQRDVSSFSTSGYSLVDRWGNNRAEGTISENGVTFAKKSTETSISYIYQRIENYSNIVGKTVTFSAIIDGDLYSVTGKFPVKNGTHLTKQITVGGDAMQLRIEFGSTSAPVTYPWCLIWNDSYNDHTVKAAKLELGTVSTLANDTAPNYATELLKCQRYFQRLKTESTDMLSIGMGFAVTTTDLRIEFPISIHMRATPNVTYSGLSDFKYTQTVGSAGISPTNITAAGGQFGNGVVVKFIGAFTEGDIYEIYTLNGYIDLSAEL